ncbi:FAD-binding oxidoreductase [Streptomyces sp. TBY4]|uniref:FAD-binding oxidoreductase n=1 Tax=Streptomyces sp. TBY4 TaxID=2962030 RepID=UPI0020B8559E|nr:FAD-binding oxidoreductase [Streptomyces sp. TBY4]MCP3759153.1 FAD-binding oxidoreductase [Streptomyces sp. TBY4]
MLNRRTTLRLGAGAAAGAIGGGMITGTATAAAPRTPPRGATGPDWSRLGSHLSGDLVLPPDASYEQASRLAIGQFDAIRPQAVAYCETEQDVQTTLAFAQDNALRLVPRSGGHSFGGYSTTTGVVLDVSRLNSLRLSTNTVVMGPGVQQVDALTKLAPRGVSVASGLCPGVCPGGFVQGGGMGWQTRKFGMASDRLVSARVVLADGRRITASATENGDLFWALRGGGGGNFGVVTSFELRPTQVPSIVNFNLTWPWEAAQRVIAAWQRWVVSGPRDLGTGMGVQWLDAGTGRPDLLVYGGWLGAPDKFAAVLDALVADVGSAPATRSVEEQTYQRAMMSYYGCSDLTPEQCHTVGYSPEAQVPRTNFAIDRSRLFSAAIPDGGIDKALEAFTANPRAGQFRFLSFFALGGAAKEPGRRDTAFVHRDTEFYAGYSLGLNDPKYTPEDEQAGRAWADNGFLAIDPYSNGESYQNFIDPSLGDWQAAYYGENYTKLRAVKQKYDRHRLFSFAQGIA